MTRPDIVYDVLWAPGVQPSQGLPLRREWRVTDPKSQSGEGTLDSPKIYLPSQQKRRTQRAIDHTKRIVSEVAKKIQCTHIWVRGYGHSFTTKFTGHGIKTVAWDDDHITVAYGNSDSTVLWEGHLYIKRFTDKTKAPKELVDPKVLGRVNPELHVVGGKIPYANLPADYPHTFNLQPGRLTVRILPPPYYHTIPE
ncbi:hypothetical protein F4820DRAFT_453904 [Hypoxylon rubiginosum]|uniref:Uncharacterized protein n=1 Tax=Hypoxylon rubiginosum TaxID=110542 RepID=A0ACB9YJ46_9PEZI|nr:hypothetical protein F4820DRAFT_453904 [Hypoxylon rubiginosum]